MTGRMYTRTNRPDGIELTFVENLTQGLTTKHKARMMARRKEQLARVAGSDIIYPAVNDAKRMSDLNRHFKRRLASSRFRKAMAALAKAAKRSVDHEA